MSLTVRILIALGLGLASGIALAEWGGVWEADVVTFAQPVGKAWLGGLQMPLIPLIFALLVTGIAQAATTARTNGMAGRAIALFAVLLVGAAVATLTGKSVRTIAANTTAANVVRSIGYAERGVTVAPATGIEVLVRVGFKWRKIAQG